MGQHLIKIKREIGEYYFENLKKICASNFSILNEMSFLGLLKLLDCCKMVDFATGYISIAYMIYGTPLLIDSILNPAKQNCSFSTDNMIAELEILTEEIFFNLKEFDMLSNWNDARDDIDKSKQNYDNAVQDDRGNYEELKKWADDDQIHKLYAALVEYNRFIVAESPTLIERMKDEAKTVVNKDDIHTRSQGRLLTDSFRMVFAEQSRGYKILFDAYQLRNDSKNMNKLYMTMIRRYHEQVDEIKKVLLHTKKENYYLIREDAYSKGDTFPLKDHKYIYLEPVYADWGKVVTGFQLYYKENSLVLKIKQGTLKKFGKIENNNWKPIDTYSWGNDHGEDGHYIKYYHNVGNNSEIFENNVDFHYFDFGFYAAPTGRAIIGIKFCTNGNRIGLCVKTKKVNFTSGSLSDESGWVNAPTKWGEDAQESIDYKSCVSIEEVSKHTVESNPEGMLTGVGLYYDDSDSFISALAIKASDYFQIEEFGESCGKYSNFLIQEDDVPNLGCCGNYIYNKKTQRCENDEPRFVGNIFSV